MSHIFISYSHIDKEYTLKLAEVLRRRGFSIWLDESIPGGTRWFQEITKAIHDSSALIVIMTPEAEQSDWVEKEILIAQDENKQIFPLLLRGKRFRLLINIQYTDVTNGELPPNHFFARLPKAANHKPLGEVLYPHVIGRWRAIKSIENEQRRNTLLGDAGQEVANGAWEIQTPDPFARGTYGPYISLTPNSYQVTFRLKIDDNTGENERLATIDATSQAAKIFFARKTLMVREFVNNDVYQDFYLEFLLTNPDDYFEFRIRTDPTFEARKRLVVDYIELRSK